MSLLNRTPVASIVFVIYSAASSVALFLDNITHATYTEGLLYVGVACGAIGYVRNQAGHGVGR
jgi:hypothetical protein